MGLSSSTKHCLTGCNEMALVRCPRRLPASELWLGIASTHRHAGGRPFKLLCRWARASGSCVAGSCGAALWTFPRDQCAKSFFIYKKIPLREYRASTGPQLQLLPPSEPPPPFAVLCAPTMAPATVRRAPYKDFLQPALHRRFSTAATIILAVAYAQSILMSDWSSCEFTYALSQLQPLPFHLGLGDKMLTTTSLYRALVMVSPRPGWLPSCLPLLLRPLHPRPAHRPVPRRPADVQLGPPDLCHQRALVAHHLGRPRVRLLGLAL